MHSTQRRFLCALIGAVLATSLPTLMGQALQFRNGGLLVGEVEEATTAGLTFRRLDNGGYLELRWEDLTAACAERIRLERGLIEQSDDEVRVTADVVTYEVAGAPMVQIGLFEDPPGPTVRVRRKGRVIEIPRQSLKRVQRREVSVYEVYTEEGYYQQQLGEIQPGDDADKNVKIAEKLRRAGDYERALKHLAKAEDLGSGSYSSALPGMIAGVRKLVESAAERAALTEIKQRIARKDFGEARRLIEAYPKTFPAAKLSALLQLEKGRLERTRRAHYTEQTYQKFEAYSLRLAREKLRDRELTIGAARNYAENDMARDLWTRLAGIVAADEELTPDDVAQLWEQRASLRSWRPKLYSYGIGSWVLGEDKILEKTAQAEAQAQDEGGRNEAERSVDDLVGRLRKLRQLAKKRASQGPRRETEDDWWQSATRDEKNEWLQAYFVEFGSGAEITRAYARPCVNCNAVGTIPIVNSSGKTVQAPCPVCQGTKFTRSFRAR